MYQSSRWHAYIELSRNWLTKFVLVWCALSLLLGLYFVDDLAVTLAAPTMTLVMYFSAIWMLAFVVGVQRINPLNPVNSNFFKYSLIFFWVGGLIGFCNFLINGILDNSEFENAGYFQIVVAAFPLGATMGAAKEWEKNCLQGPQ